MSSGSEKLSCLEDGAGPVKSFLGLGSLFRRFPFCVDFHLSHRR